MQKHPRPYCALEIEIDGILYAIPLRHHIAHKYAFFTCGKSGLDFTKAVVIEPDKHISDTVPWIDTKEWNLIKQNGDKIFYQFRKFIKLYKKASSRNDPRQQSLLKYCTLQYFNIENKKPWTCYFSIFKAFGLVAGGGLEPPTSGLWARRATNCSTPRY